MSKKVIENPTIDQVQPGDWVEGTYKGHEFAGEVWNVARALMVGGDTIRYGYHDDEIEITSITRDVPDLPTKPGTVGHATVRGVPNVRIIRTDIQDAWVSGRHVDDQQFHGEKHIDAESFVLELEGDE